MHKEDFYDVLKGHWNMYNSFLESYLYLFQMCFQVDMGQRLK